MEEILDLTTELIPTALDRELQLIREAIVMVAGGGAPRVIIAGIRFGAVLLEPGSRLALEAGVRLLALDTADGPGIDLAVVPTPQ